jgi:predicted ribosomally synthesized peptide with SipW-like signal peptide
MMEGRTMSDGTRRGFGRRLHRKILGSMVVLGLVGVVAGVGTWSAFSATTANTGNSFSAGTVVLADNDSGAMFVNLTGLKPGDSYTNCIRVDYTGSLAANVKLYGTTGGTGLDPYLNLTVTRGTAGAWNTCAGWTADSTDYIGSGAGVIYSGTLQGFADSYAAGLVDAPGATESWTNAESHYYRFNITVADNNAAQGLTATQTFTWEARNT